MIDKKLTVLVFTIAISLLVLAGYFQDREIKKLKRTAVYHAEVLQKLATQQEQNTKFIKVIGDIIIKRDDLRKGEE